MTTDYAKQHLLDVDKFEVARSVHRVVRGMHDGECPACHTLHDSQDMRKPVIGGFDLVCPACGFYILSSVQLAAIKEFGPVMDRNLAVFEEWRNNLASST